MQGTSASAGAWTPQAFTHGEDADFVPAETPRRGEVRRFDTGHVARPPPAAALARARATAAALKKAVPAPVASVPQARAEKPRKSAKRLLLIEPERAFGAALSGWVGGNGEFDVIQVTTLHNAGAVLRAGGVDLIIASVEVSDGNSLALVSDVNFGHIPKLFLSEQASAYRERLGAGVHLIEKPVSPARLRQEVRSLSAPVVAVAAPANLDEAPRGPATIPQRDPMAAESTPQDFEEIWLEARAQLTGRDYKGAVQTLRRARTLRPDEERVTQSLNRLQSMGFQVD
jgi:hypothetical protein